MKNLIDRLIEFDNELIMSFKERYPRLTNLILKMYDGKKFGYQFMDESGDIKGEYTIMIDNNRMTFYEECIGEVYMAARCRISFVEDTLENYRDGFLNRPFRTLLRYTVKSLYAIVKGDIKLGKKK